MTSISVTVKEGKKLSQLILKEGTNLIKALRDSNIKIADACEGNLGCGTCHLYLDDKTFNKLPMCTDKEEDLLTFSPGLKKNSRLACGITVDSKLNDAFITIPELNRNIINEDDM